MRNDDTINHGYWLAGKERYKNDSGMVIFDDVRYSLCVNCKYVNWQNLQFKKTKI